MFDRPLRTALVTGAGGFVGTTLVQHLLAQGTRVVALDSFERGHRDTVPPSVHVVAGDVRDPEAVREALQACGSVPEAVFHLAALILVGESVAQPDRYLSVNAEGTRVVAEACLEVGVPALVLASSAAVLGPEQGGAEQLDESAAIDPESPYGLSKWQAEQTLAAAAATGRISTIALRFFNVSGADCGCAERHEPESHLIPLAVRAAWGDLPPLKVFGTDWPTPDGTCLRDYVHMRDVIAALIRGAKYSRATCLAGQAGHEVLHVGSGRPSSVLEVIHAVEKVMGVPVPHVLTSRRDGDIAALVAESSKMRVLLGIEPCRDLVQMVADCVATLRRA